MAQTTNRRILSDRSYLRLDWEMLGICSHDSLRILSVNYAIVNCLALLIERFADCQVLHQVQNALVDLAPMLDQENFGRRSEESLNLIAVLSHFGGCQYATRTLSLKAKSNGRPLTSKE